MPTTNFTELTDEQKAVWSRDLWAQARNMSFIEKFVGNDHNAVVQRVTELTEDERGDRAVITLVADIDGDGVTGDNTMEGNEVSIPAYDQTINIDQLRQANRHKGKLAAQKSVVNFREQSRNKLAYWLADRRDQLAILTLSGIAYTKTNKGGTRPVLGGGTNGMNFSELAFASDVSAPTNMRHTRWDASNGLVSSAATSDIAAGDTFSYATIVEAKQFAKDHGIRGVRPKGGLEEQYHMLVTPTDMKNLELDPDFLNNQRNAGVRGDNNRLFAGGSSVMVNGVWVHEFRHVFNTKDAVSGTGKWGAGSDIDGSRLLFLGAQALGLADISMPEWVEKEFDYDNQPGISCGQIFGMLKPKFKTPFDRDTDYLPTEQDHGVLVVDVSHS